MTGPTGIDESYSFADVAELKRRGVEVVMLYGSHTSGKNATPAKVQALHGAGIGVLIGFEDTASRSLLGRTAGLADGQFMHGFMDALQVGVGYAPKNVTYHPAAYDFDTNPAQYPTLDGYQGGYNEGIAPRGGGAYGEADLLDHFGAADLLKGGGFGTYAWSRGFISQFDDFHQYLNGQKIGNADVDFDRVLHPIRLGAWWPPGHKYDTPPGGNMSANGPEHWDAKDWAAMYAQGAAMPNFNKAGGAANGKRQTLYTFMHNWFSPIRADLAGLRADINAIKSKMGA